MNAKPLFCPRCKRNVQFVLTEAPTHEGHANLRDEEAICLECGEACLGQICPVTNMPNEVMETRLEDFALKFGIALPSQDRPGS
jgi:hypothetical protein